MSGSLNQPGLSESDNDQLDQGTPPDSTGAIAPNFYVEIVNSRVGIYSRSSLGLVAPSVPLSDFVGFPGDNVFDPQIEWDPQGGRWLYAAIDNNDLVYGWSQTADPAAGWCHYSQSANPGTSEDYPKLGHDDSHLLVGTNVFSTAPPFFPFISSRIWSVPKPPNGMTSCPSAPATSFPMNPVTNPLMTDSHNSAFTPVPANIGDTSSTGWVVSADQNDSNGEGSQIQLWRIGGTATSPTFDSAGEVNVSPFAPPPLVPQPGTALTLDPLDGRLTQAVAKTDADAGGAEAIWTQHTIATSDGRSSARWYEILPTSPALRQQGEINDPGLYAFNAAISPTSAGNDAVIEYNTASSSQLPDIRAQSRRSATPQGLMGNETTLGQSSQVDRDQFCGSNPPCRWGDYSGATPDPNDGTLVWGSNQLTGPPQGDQGFQWLTRNFALIATGRPPAAALTTPSSVGKGDQVRLDASGSTADVPITDYSWDLDGNGSFETDTGTSPMVTHAFTKTGPVNVSVKVTEERGASSLATRQINVVDHPAIAAFTFSKNPTIKKVVRFNATRSTDVDGRIVDYMWDLDGNGTFETDSGSIAATSRTYTKPKKMNVHLRVRDDDGVTSDTTVVLVAHVGVKLSLKKSQKLPGPVRLKATCTGTCTATFALQLTKRQARKLHLSRTIGRTKKKLRANKKKSASVKLAKKALRRIARLSKLKVTLVVTVKDASKVPFKVTRTVTLKR